MGNAPAGVDSAGVSSDEDEQGGKLSSSNMLEQLAKRYQGKPSSPSGIHTRYRVTSTLYMGRFITAMSFQSAKVLVLSSTKQIHPCFSFVSALWPCWYFPRLLVAPFACSLVH